MEETKIQSKAPNVVDFQREIQNAKQFVKDLPMSNEVKRLVDDIKSEFLKSVKEGCAFYEPALQWQPYDNMTICNLAVEHLRRYSAFFQIKIETTAHNHLYKVSATMNERVTDVAIDEWSAQLVDAYAKIVDTNITQIQRTILSKIKANDLVYRHCLAHLRYKHLFDQVVDYFVAVGQEGFATKYYIGSACCGILFDFTKA